jgi:hypothetical protein
VPATASLRWQQDPFGNHVAHVGFEKGTRLSELELRVELARHTSGEPFDFIDER